MRRNTEDELPYVEEEQSADGDDGNFINLHLKKFPFFCTIGNNPVPKEQMAA